MKTKNLSEFPIQTEHNRVQRLYTGGKLLDRWQKIAPEVDSIKSEDLLITTVEYIGSGHPDHKGVSQVRLQTGETADLRTLISSNPKEFLGSNLINDENNPKVLVRVGDSNVRLVIQCHPTKKMAKKYFNINSGKTEAWYIADTRQIDGINPHLYCGFKTGITREYFKKLFETQDIQGMLNCMHKLEVNIGDMVMIKAGMPHAMGSGCLFVEIHEACDYTIRVEKKYSTKKLNDLEMHYGLGFEIMLDFFDYTTYDEKQIYEVVMGKLTTENVYKNSKMYNCFNELQSEFFCVKKLELFGEYPMAKFDGHYIMITIKNDIEIIGEDQSLVVKQGNGIFVPANTKTFSIRGKGEILMAFPPCFEETKGSI